MNPILDVKHFVPDVEARQWSDGRMYLYGSYDLSGNPAYCSHEYHVLSFDDLIDWQDHGVSLRTTGAGAPAICKDEVLYAPDCVYKDGLYYLYFCTSSNCEYVATSPDPQGPFVDPQPVAGLSGDSIDPAVLIDDDGQAYIFWGQFHLRGAKLNPDMRSIDCGTRNDALLDEARHGFHEGASIRKRGGIYYMLYTDISRGKATCLSYATSRHPLGPYEKGGVVIDNTGCDKGTWNNHGSLAQFDGGWYLFYHRSSQGNQFNRRVCAEPIRFREDGGINEVQMTTQGLSASLDAREETPTWRACLLSGSVMTESVGPCSAGEAPYEDLCHIQRGDWAAFRYLDFGRGVQRFEAQVASLSDGGSIEIVLDRADGRAIGTCAVPPTGGWQMWERVSCEVEPVQGVHALYLRFTGLPDMRLMSLKEFRFQ